MTAAELRTAGGPQSGAAMDRVVPISQHLRWLRRLAALCMALLVLWGASWLWQARSPGVSVRLADVDLGLVANGTFHDELSLSATVAPQQSVMLDTTEGGRVDAVLVADGTRVRRGDELLRLSNPQRELELMARSAEVAQQLANLSGLRAQWVASHALLQRELQQRSFELVRQEKAHARTVDLARQGFVSAAAAEDSADQLAQLRTMLAQQQADSEAEERTRSQSVTEMARAVEGLSRRLQLMRDDGALALRAPADGRLTGFAPQVGATMKAGDRLGRIDSADRFLLSAAVDEFYLGRVAVGLAAQVEMGERRWPMQVARIDPQVQNGRFRVELQFDASVPAAMQAQLSAGQTLAASVRLGRPAPALLLPDGAFYADTGGAWVFVVDAEGAQAERRAVRLGRRAAGQIEVLAGLAPGERVLTSSYRAFATAQALRLQR
ncbi:HlyD family efflux transporter periplasmic adaptor subunit [Ideonella azotifigens]|uniref:Efflux RND transporter periplasmic adaptor subunit n=1 Tax=Ideonella azotifigens TaxID=513160 RepID=A0ABN1KL97_9BURK|nr:HlyD family efflux transporter periplasmic adaptor subunit [Ideonella azotifigens]MCD2344800.1 HlyD family efflux transporter periplasmic adaptor subunit [Ideonella azotifigens]